MSTSRLKSAGLWSLCFTNYTNLFANKKYMYSKFQIAFTNLWQWFWKWRIDIDPTKNRAVIFQRSQLPGTTASVSRGNSIPAIKIFGQPTPWASKAKYLGVTLDRGMTSGPTLSQCAAEPCSYSVDSTPWSVSEVNCPFVTRCVLYKTCKRSVMTYASEVFAHAAHTHINTLQVIGFYRISVGASWYVRNVDLHEDLNLVLICQYLKVGSKCYFTKAARQENRLILA